MSDFKAIYKNLIIIKIINTMKKYILVLSICVFIMESIFAQLQTGFHYKIKNDYKPFLSKSTYGLTIYYTTDKAVTKAAQTVCSGTTSLKANVLQDDKDPTLLKVDFWAIKPSDVACQILP